MTHGRSISPPDRRHGNGQRLRLLFALLVMCLAVVPHVTLAASLMRMPMTASGQHEANLPGTPAASVMAAPEVAPCHQPPPSAKGHPAGAPPICCIIGCGLIAEAPVVALPSRTILWSRPGLALAETRAGISTEPAKPPPRSELARS